MPLVSKSFSDIITFSRNSNATYFDSAGVLKYAPNNAIRNNTMVGAVAGTPGTLPTNWAFNIITTTGLTTEVVGTGTESGITYLDFKVAGTASGTGSLVVQFESNGVITASSGQTWAGSVYWKIAAGTLNGLSGGVLRIDERSGAFLATQTLASGVPTSGSLSGQRISGAATLANASTTNIVPYIRFSIANATAIDITLRIGLPQLEIGDTAGPAIPTSGTAYYGPRFDYDPATLAAQGLLIEEQRTNLLRYSEQFDNAAWFVSGLTVNANATVAPDGTVTADLVTGDGTLNSHFIRQQPSATGTTIHTFSVYLKQGTGRYAYLVLLGRTPTDDNGDSAFIDLQTGIITATGGSGVSAAVTSVGNGWFRLSMPTSQYPSSTQIEARIGISDAAGLVNITTSDSILVWGAQLEAGAFPTSYIPTTTTALTRAADVAAVNTLSPWYNATEGTVFVEASPQTSNVVTFNLVDLNNTTTNNRISLSKVITSGNASLFVNDAASAQCNISSATWTATGKLAGAYAANDFSTSYNGATPVTDTSGTVPSVTRLQIGIRADGGNKLTGHIRRITYYPRRLSNAELQAITS